MTRTANGAQRSGAAVLTLVFTRPREVYGAPCDYFRSSFFCASPTPARWLQRRLWAQWPGGSPPGSLVLNGPGDRTTKRLKSNGSVVLFRTLTRDACADVCGCTRIENLQNHRTTEPEVKTLISPEVMGSLAVLARFCGSAPAAPRYALLCEVSDLAAREPNKEWGGYSSSAVAGRIGALPGLNGGAGRRKFWRQRAGGAAIGRGGAEAEVAGENGGFLPFFGSASVRVGTPMLERRQKTADFCGLCVTVHQPAGLAAVDLGGALTPPGVDAVRQGGTPPSRPRDLSRPFAQPIFRVSAALLIRRDPRVDVDLDRPVNSKPETGSGVRDLRRLSGHRRADAIEAGLQQRVGVQGAILSRGRSRRAETLWGGRGGVN